MKEEYLNAKVFTIKKHLPVLDDYGEHLNINPFDFKRPSKFNKDQVRILEIVHNSFSKLIETRLSIVTRNVTDINLVMVEQKTFGEYLNNLADYTFITVVSASLFENDTLLHIGNELLFVLLDRILGGGGQSNHKREFTDIELNLIEGVMEEFVLALKEAWSNFDEPSFHIKNMETNPQFARPVPSNEMCLVFNFRMETGEKKGNFSFCIPYVSIKPVLDKMDAKSIFTDGRQTVSKGTATLKHSLAKLELSPSVVLGKSRITLSNMENLEVGDIIKLDRSIGQNLEMVVGNKVMFQVQPGKVSNRLAVQIVESNDSEV